MATIPTDTPASTTAPTSVKTLTDMLLAQKMVSIVNSIMQDNGTSTILFSWKQIAGLLAMLSIEEVRTVISDTFNFVKDTIKKYACVNSITTILNIFKKSYLFIVLHVKQIMFRRNIIETSNVIILEPKINTIKIQLDSTLFNLIINEKYSKNELKYSVDYESTEYEFETIHKTKRTEKWNNIQFMLSPQINVNLLSNYIAIINHANQLQINKNNIVIETDSYRLIPREGFGDLSKRCLFKDGLVNLLYIFNITTFKPERIKFKNEYDSALKFTNNNKLSESYIHIHSYLFLICLLYTNITKKPITNEIWQALTGSNSTFISFDADGIDYSYYCSLLLGQHNKKIEFQYKFMIEQAEKGYYVEWKQYYMYETPKVIDNLYKTTDIVPDFNIITKQSIYVSSATYSTTELLDTFNTYVKTIGKDIVVHSATDTPQKLYFLTISRKKETHKIPNPDYESWDEMRKEILALNSDSVESKATDKMLTLAYKSPPPPKTITEIKESSELICKELSTCFKPIDTLYLSQIDLESLYSSLNIFKNQKERLRILGIPNKYGLFLSGPPGTGKTSTVYAVATFLQKSIYYVSLNEIRTNRELSQLFDHVNAKTVGGGIIVFEDIDAMTDVVLKRSNCIESSVVDSMSEEDGCLTLSYLLNIMDGVMSQDGMIVIATSNHPEKLDPAFLREGRFNMSISLGYADHYQINKIFNKFFERDIDTSVLSTVSTHTYTPAQFIFRCMNYILTPGTSDAIILEPFLGT